MAEETRLGEPGHPTTRPGKLMKMHTARERPPPYFRRRIGWIGVVMGATIVIATLVHAILAFVSVRTATTFSTAMEVVMVSFVLLAFFGLWQARKLKARLRRAAGALCPRCGYDLTGLDDDGKCPECGTEFTRADLAAYWKRHVDFGVGNGPMQRHDE